VENQDQNTGVAFAGDGVGQSPTISSPTPATSLLGLEGLSLDPDSLSRPSPAVPIVKPKTRTQRIVQALRRADIVLVVLLCLGLIGLVVANTHKRPTQSANNNIQNQYSSVQIPLSGFVVNEQGVNFGTSSVVVNGAMRLNDGLVVAPSVQPNAPKAGQIYYDQNTNELAYYNGTAFVPLSASGTVVQTVGGLSGDVTLGGGLSVVGNQLANAGVVSFGGQSGAISVGSGLKMNGATLQNASILSLTAGTTNLQIASDANGNLTISSVGAGTGTVSSTGGTAGQVALFTGAQAIGDSVISQSGTTVTVTGDLNVSGGATLGTPLGVTNGGTGANTLAANGVLVGNGAGVINSVTAASAGLCLVSTAGTPAFASCSGGGGVTSLDGLTGALTIANSTGSGSAVTINDATTGSKGIASFSATNFSVLSGVVNTVQNINTAASPTFAGVNTNTITPSAALTVGSATQNFTLQGAAGSLISATSGALSTTLNFQTPTANTTYRFATTSGGTFDVCTTFGNCVGLGGTVSGSGTTGTLPVFTGAQTVGDSLLSQSGGVLTSNGNLNLTSGHLFQVNGSQITSANLSNDSNLAKLNASQTFTGATNTFKNTADSALAFAVQNAGGAGLFSINTSVGDVELGQAGTQAGQLLFDNASNANTVALISAAVSGNRTITLPDASGTVCLSIGNCAGAAVTLQSAYNNSTSPEITLDATRGALTVRDNATPIGANLFEVQNNAGSTTYLAVTTSGASVTGSFTASGTVNSSGGTLQTNSITRVDNAGNLANIGSMSLAGSISGGTTYTGSGTINTTGGAIQTNSTTRIDNSGNALNIGNVTLSGAISGGTTYSGSGNINSSGGALQTSGVTRVDNSGNLINIVALTASGNANLQGGTITLGTNAQAGTLSLNDGATHTGNIVTAALGQNTVYTLPDPGAGTATICLTSGNCAGSGGGVTGSGTNNRLAKFTSTGGTIGNSTISDTGTTVTTSVNLVVQGGSATLGIANSQTGSLVLAYGAANFSGTLVQGALTGAQTYTLPDASGTVCLSSGNCLGGGGGGANTALSNLSSVAINTSLLPGSTTVDLGASSTPFRNLYIAGSSLTPGTNNFTITGTATAARTITLPDSTGTVCLNNSSNCGFATGSGSAFVQNGNSFSAAGVLGTNDNNALNIRTNGLTRLAIAAAGDATFSGNLTVNGSTLSSGSALSITPGGSLTVGATGQTLTLQGNASSTFTATGGGFTTTVGFSGTPVGAVTYNFDRAATAGTYTICTTIGNCSSAGGGVTTAGGTIGTLPVFTGSQVIGDSLLAQSGGVLTASGHFNLTSGHVYEINGTQISSANLSNDSNLAKLNASQTFTGATVAFENGSDSTNAFNVQNALGNTVLTVSTSGHSLILGKASTLDGTLVFNNASNGNTVTIVPGTPTANRTLTLPDASGIICTDSGNCAGSGGGVTTAGGTNNTIAKFTGSQTLGNSGITDNGTTVGIGELFTQTLNVTSGSASTFAVTDSAGSGTTTLQGVAINLAGTNNASGSNTITGLSFGSVSAATNNTFNGIAFGTGFSSLLSYNGTTLLSGTGLLQNAAIDSSATYSNLQKVGALSTGSIASGFGTISTGNTITTTAAIQGGTGIFTNNNALTLGTASSNTGAIVFKGSGGTGTLTLQGPTTPNTGNFALTLPAVNANANICTDNSASGCSLQTAYNASAGGANTTIKLSSAVNDINIQDANGGLGGGNFLSLRAQNASGLGAVVFGFAIQGQFFEKPTTDSTTTVQIENSAGNTLFAVDSSGGYINLGSTGGSTGGTGSAFNGTTTNIETSPNANTVTNIGSTAQNSGTATINIGYTNTAGGGSAVNIGSGPNATGTTVIQGNGVTITAGAASTWSTSAGNLTIQAASTNTLLLDTGGTGTVNVGTSNAGTVNIGAQNGLRSSTVNIATDSSGTQTVNIGSDNSGDVTTILGGSSGGLNLGNGSNSETINIGSAIANSTTVNIKGGSSGGTINIGNVIATQTIAIGSSGSSSTTSIQGGNGASAVQIDAQASGTLSLGSLFNENLLFGSGSTTGTTTLGGTSQTGAITIGRSTSSNTISIGDAATTNTQTVNIASSATGAGVDTVTIGSTNGSSATTIQGGTGNINLTTNASTAGTKVHTNTNSATAFIVQNSSSVNYLTVDTANDKIIIGPSAGDTTGTILVLGNKTNTGDPTGVDGAMYYNSSLNKFRCREAGFWRDCIASANSDWNITNEMISATNDAYFTFAVSGTNAVNDDGTQAGATGHPGIVEQETGTTAAGASLVSSSDRNESSILLGNGDYWRYETDVKIPVLSTGTQRFIYRAGFDDANNLGNIDGADGCYFKYSDNVNGGKWQGVCNSNSSSTTCDTTIAVSAGTWYRLTVAVNTTGTSADFYVNGVDDCQVTSNIPTGAGRNTTFQNSLAKTIGTTSVSVYLDYIDLQAQFAARN